MTATEYFLGIDVGATKSHALIATDDGRVAGFGRGGPGNHERVGYAGLAEALQQATGQALQMAGIERSQVAGAGFGVAGYDWPSELAPTLDAIATLHLSCPLEVVNDTIIGLVAGAEAGWGVAVVAGTGTNCWGWDEQRRIGRVTGNGSRFGENGGASELVEEAVRAVSRAWSRRGPATALSEGFARLVGASSDAELLEWLSQDQCDIGAEAAPLVFEIARAGDAVAGDVVRWAGASLGDLAAGVIRQIGLEERSFEVVLVGSLYSGGPILIEPMREVVQATAAGARLVRLETPPVAGAVLLGYEAAGRQAGLLRGPLCASIRELLSSEG
jgi:N-acetylglucosamine kinase-like BadF-type ATPase